MINVNRLVDSQQPFGNPMIGYWSLYSKPSDKTEWFIKSFLHFKHNYVPNFVENKGALIWMSLFASSSWCLGRAAVCDCGTSWTFLLPPLFLLFYFFRPFVTALEWLVE